MSYYIGTVYAASVITIIYIRNIARIFSNYYHNVKYIFHNISKY